ncbi:hypothetical protein [Acinetobacter baumannii]|uniref:hypothetical protein n=1 Tax=Acinetobacter baumannii TaxID=470 RepID=UPI000D1BC744|nr:hypothetical protein [Acinetobacter baumannii]DAH82776.1 MAG TPA: hypothetical protein [Caudoviricetes sp.]
MTIVADTIDLSSGEMLESFKLTLLKPGTAQSSGWTIELAGPSHPQFIALANESIREVIHKEKVIETAQVNNRKYKVEEETPDERRRRNVAKVCGRIIGWSPNPTFTKISPLPLEFSVAAATDLFLRPELGAWFVQITEYLNSETAFIQPSGAT